MAKTIFKPVLLCATLIFFSLNLNAASTDNFSASNYIYLEETVTSKKDVTADLKNLLKSNMVFLYVSGCHLDKEALPAFQGLTRRYRQVKFLRVSQHSSAARYLLERYGSFGAPKIYFIKDGNLVSHVTYSYIRAGRRSRFAGWKQSIEKWAADLYPHVRQLPRHPNIYPVSSFNYRAVLEGKKVVLLRTDVRSRDFPAAMRSLFQAAARFRHITFAFDTRSIPYNQEFDYRFRKAYNSYSVISNGAVIESSFRKGRQRTYNHTQLSQWIKSNFEGGVAKKPSSAKDAAWLKKVFASADSYQLSAMNPGEFKRLNNRHQIVKSLRLQQSFYVLINAITDPRRNKKTALVLIQELKYTSQGGFKNLVKSPVTRKKVYANLIGRLIAHEKDKKIRKGLQRIEDYYNR